MKIRIWPSNNVDALLDSFPRDLRDLYEEAAATIALSPYETVGIGTIWRSRRNQRWFMSFYNGRFPYILRYEIEEYPTTGEAVITVISLDDFTLLGDPVDLPPPSN